MLSEKYIASFSLLKDKIKDKGIYPYNLPVVQHLNSIDLHKNVTFLVGENGTGKSTLLEAVAIQYGFNPEGGSKNFNFLTEKSHSALSENIRLSRGIKKAKDGYFLRAESFYNVASNIDQLDREGGLGAKIIDSYGGKSLHEQSHGESFFSLFLHRFGANGMYILDEPEAALSPQRQLAFLLRLDELVKQKSQFIIATHSPIVLSYPNAKIIQISKNGFEELDYKKTEHYELYKMFFDNPEQILHKLKIEKLKGST